MAWCPVCKCEYVEGITKCADCGCDLVDELPNEQEIENSEELSADEPAEEFAFEEEEEVKPVRHSVYVNNEEKAEENKTSAYTLLLVGGAGLVLVILFFLDIIHLSMEAFNRYLISGVMGVMFLLFVVMGIVSLRNFKVFKKRAVKENSLTQEIRKWCLQNLQKEQIDEQLNIHEMEEELKYFQRFEYVKSMVQKQFVNLDEAYLDRLVEEMYAELFEEEQS